MVHPVFTFTIVIYLISELELIWTSSLEEILFLLLGIKLLLSSLQPSYCTDWATQLLN
jgi:hypothetical protein